MNRWGSSRNDRARQPQRPRRVFGVGVAPDPRFTLANERTFLAWLRTALALLAAGVALDTFVGYGHPAVRSAATMALIAAGIVCSVAAYARWMATERALRLGQPLPTSYVAPLVAFAVATAGVLAAVILLGS